VVVKWSFGWRRTVMTSGCWLMGDLVSFRLSGLVQIRNLFMFVHVLS
jgi:hypothetical protein